MKALHLLLVVVCTFTLCMSAVSENGMAATDKKEVTAPVDKAGPVVKGAQPDDGKKTAKAVKEIPKDVNVNTADKEMLALLPGIGPVTTNTI